MKNFIVILILFFTVHVNLQAYSHLSPYAYCAGNPVNYVDPTGEDIVVLNWGNGLNQHLAMLIQNEEGKWQYYSVNGNNNIYVSGVFSGGRPFNDVGVGNWDSPQEFFDSSYNTEGGDQDKNVNSYGFYEGYQIETTPEQDETMRNSFEQTAQEEYNLFGNNCATAVQKAMFDAGIPVSEPILVPNYVPMSTPFGIVDVFNGYKMKCDFNIVPSSVFQSIMKWNPKGSYIHK